jgi:Cohesin domain
MNRRILLMAGWWVLFVPALAAAAVRVLVMIPHEIGEPGSRFDVPIAMVDGDEDVASYALKVRYNRRVLRVVEVGGGSSAGFAKSPVTDLSTYGSGQTVFTAVNDGFQPIPPLYRIATLTFEVIGRPRDRSKLVFRLAPRTDVTLTRTFARARRVSIEQDKKWVVVP